MFSAIAKHTCLLIALSCPLAAELIATFQTSLGNVVVSLQYEQTPQTVGNFITLAQGTRNHVASSNGSLTRSPYYTGEKFYRVVNDAGFKIAQTGSGTGTNGGGPGYTFKDEFHPTLTHVPFVLSMANSGPHTNGSQIYFTGNTPIPSLDNKHTVFGLVPDAASRAVVDAILAAGDNGSSITGVTFSRTDAAAVAFDEFAQNLPECQPAPGSIAVTLGTAVNFVLKKPMASGTTLQAYRSLDLAAWSRLGEIYQGTGAAGFSSITLENITPPRAFYQLTTVTYPNALAPASLASRTLTTNLAAARNFVFTFDSTAIAGTVTDSQAPASAVPFTLLSYTKTAYKATWQFNTTTLGTLTINTIFKSETASQLLGTATVQQRMGAILTTLGSGEMALTK